MNVKNCLNNHDRELFSQTAQSCRGYPANGRSQLRLTVTQQLSDEIHRSQGCPAQTHGTTSKLVSQEQRLKL